MRIVFDIVEMKPACALIQAAMGCDSRVANAFDASKDWLTFPTPNMSVYEVTQGQLDILVQKVKERRRK